MATFKLSIKRGQRAENVTVAAGSAIAGSDALELNVDATAMSKGELLQQINELKKQILQSPFPQPTA
jgi:hypothetical protein